MNKHIYPNNWRELREACVERANRQCELCHAQEGAIVTSRRTGRLYILYLHAAHIDADPHNPDARLIALCPSCHMRQDRQQEMQERKSVRRRGYSLTTTDNLVRALSIAGLVLTETETGYQWAVDDLEGEATTAVHAVADAIYHLRQQTRK